MLWHKCHNKRTLPWKEEKDPYRIWVSEIILQQTRAEQGILYYQKFLAKFSDIRKLADASLEEVYQIWEGLGYYNRARNMHETANEIMQVYGGQFPSDYETILSLKGIGPYTAAAISSFAFKLPYAVVDGNVFRVLSRFFGIQTAIDSTEGKKIFSDIARECLDESKPHLYNQAIMDFGATICKPEQPLCKTCPLSKKCYAFKNKISAELPVKNKKKSIKRRYFLFLIYMKEGKIGIEKRTEKDIWKNLFQFPLVEVADLDMFENPFSGKINKLVCKRNLVKETTIVKQQLSHQLVFGKGLIYTKPAPSFTQKDIIWVSFREIKKYPFPRLIHSLLKEGHIREILKNATNEFK